MKKYNVLSSVIILILMINIACEKDNDIDKKNTNYNGNWQRIGYVFNGNIGIDTVTIQQVEDSIFITDNEFIDEIGLIEVDTIDIIKSNLNGFSFLKIISDSKLNSNSPINRTIDSIIFKRIN